MATKTEQKGGDKSVTTKTTYRYESEGEGGSSREPIMAARPYYAINRTGGGMGGGSSMSMHMRSSVMSQPSSMATPAGAYQNISALGTAHVQKNRKREKKDMQDLNERLASYIEKVRFLEAQNKKLAAELDELRAKWGKETAAVKAMYEAELAQARKLLDESEKERCRLELKVPVLQEELDREKHRNVEMAKGIQDDKDKIERQYQQLSDYEGEINLLRRRINSLETENKKDKCEIKRLMEELARAKQDLDNETLNRVCAENDKQSLIEELEFLRNVHEQEMKELAALAYRDTTAENREFWKNELSQAIHDIQVEYESKLDGMRGELGAFYDAKMQEFRSGATRQNMESTHAKEEVKKLRGQISDLRAKLADLEAKNQGLEKLYNDAIRDLEEKEREFEMEKAEMRAEIDSLRGELESVLAELQNLLDAKLSLELEIAAYRKLLEGEETRIGLRSVVESVMGGEMGGQEGMESSLMSASSISAGGSSMVMSAGSGSMEIGGGGSMRMGGVGGLQMSSSGSSSMQKSSSSSTNESTLGDGSGGGSVVMSRTVRTTKTMVSKHTNSSSSASSQAFSSSASSQAYITDKQPDTKPSQLTPGMPSVIAKSEETPPTPEGSPSGEIPIVPTAVDEVSVVAEVADTSESAVPNLLDNIEPEGLPDPEGPSDEIAEASQEEEQLEGPGDEQLTGEGGLRLDDVDELGELPRGLQGDGVAGCNDASSLNTSIELPEEEGGVSPSEEDNHKLEVSAEAVAEEGDDKFEGIDVIGRDEGKDRPPDLDDARRGDSSEEVNRCEHVELLKLAEETICAAEETTYGTEKKTDCANVTTDGTEEKADDAGVTKEQMANYIEVEGVEDSTETEEKTSWFNEALTENTGETEDNDMEAIDETKDTEQLLRISKDGSSEMADESIEVAGKSTGGSGPSEEVEGCEKDEGDGTDSLAVGDNADNEGDEPLADETGEEVSLMETVDNGEGKGETENGDSGQEGVDGATDVPDETESSTANDKPDIIAQEASGLLTDEASSDVSPLNSGLHHSNTPVISPDVEHRIELADALTSSMIDKGEMLVPPNTKSDGNDPKPHSSLVKKSSGEIDILKIDFDVDSNDKGPAGNPEGVNSVSETPDITEDPTSETGGGAAMKGEMSAKTTYQRSAKGNISVAECDASGKFIVLENTGKKDESFDGWKITRKIEGKPPVNFNVPRCNAGAGKKIKIWVQGGKPAGSSDFECDVKSIGIGGNIVTILINADGEERATHTQRTTYSS